MQYGRSGIVTIEMSVACVEVWVPGFARGNLTTRSASPEWGVDSGTGTMRYDMRRVT
jgi:hypothetical protein